MKLNRIKNRVDDISAHVWMDEKGTIVLNVNGEFDVSVHETNPMTGKATSSYANLRIVVSGHPQGTKVPLRVSMWEKKGRISINNFGSCVPNNGLFVGVPKGTPGALAAQALLDSFITKSGVPMSAILAKPVTTVINPIGAQAALEYLIYEFERLGVPQMKARFHAECVLHLLVMPSVEAV